MKKNILLVEPKFPYPTKSKNKANLIHKNFIPIGLLKLGSYYKYKKNKVKLVRGNKSKKELNYFKPNKILITSIFTYWSKYVWDSVAYYRKLFPKSKIVVGGIYVTLHHKTKDFKKRAKKFKIKWHIGIHEEAERFLPDYSLLNGGASNYHATHAMRGCIRRCKFCGTWKIEPKLIYKTPKELINELKSVGKNKVVFYDNNFLANPNINQILKELSKLRINNKPVICEPQSGFDGRLLDLEVAKLIKKARFQVVRIAWDNSISDAKSIKKQINYLTKAGYPAKDIAVFMIYNFSVPYEEMLKKLNYCRRWGVQIIDCRYRPLNSITDNYLPHAFRKGQTEKDYYIHSDWTDKKIRKFRRKIRKHNIWIRYAKDKGLKYDKRMEKWSAIHNTFKFFNLGRPPELDILENGNGWGKRIKNMNIIKNYYKRNRLSSPDFSNLKIRKLDKKLKELNNQLILKKGF